MWRFVSYFLLAFCDRGTDLEGEVVVQVAIEMSLDEWRALQESSRPKSELNLRKADTEVPSKARVIHESNLREVSTCMDSVAPAGGHDLHITTGTQ